MNNKSYERVWRITMIPRQDFSGMDPGRAVVISDSGNVDWGTGFKTQYETNPLHCKFNVESMMSEPHYGELTVYNMSKDTINLLAFEGSRLIIEAGYKGAWGKIWDGNVFQFIEYRENVTDRVCIFNTVRGKVITADTFIVASLSGKRTINNRVEHVTQQLRMDVEPSKELKEEVQQTVRRTVFFGEGKKYLRDEMSLRGRKLVVNDIGKYTDSNIAKDVSTGEVLEISPESGLIGLPQQVDRGVSFQCLLDHRLKYDAPNYVTVRLKNTEVKGLKMQYGGKPPLMDKKGEYTVISVTHAGDTRGNDWYSNVQTVVNPAMIVENAPSGGEYTANGRYG